MNNAFTIAVLDANLRELRKQVADERKAHERTIVAAARRETQLVRYYTRKLRWTRFVFGRR